MSELTKEQKALGAFLAAMHDCGHDGAKMREAMFGVLGLTAESAEQREQGQAPGNTLLSRVEELYNKAFMPWREAEHLALSESGIGNSKIDELIGECASSPVVTILDDEEVREFVRSILVHSGPLYTTPPTPPTGVPDGYVLVPVEPTPEMLAALWAYKSDSLQDCYRAMLSAAPQPAAQTQEREAGT